MVGDAPGDILKIALGSVRLAWWHMTDDLTAIESDPMFSQPLRPGPVSGSRATHQLKVV